MSAAAAAHAHLGRRGAFLLIAGTGKVCYGAGLLVEPPPRADGLLLLTELCDLRHWAWLWILAGLATVGCAFLRVGRDRWGFIAALVPPIVWATSYSAGALSGEYARGAWVALWYLTSHIGVILWASTVPEYAAPPPPQGEAGETA